MVATISGNPSSWMASQRVLGFQIYPPWSQTLAPWGMAFAEMLHACTAYVWLHWVHPGNQTYLGISFLKNCVVFKNSVLNSILNSVLKIDWAKVQSRGSLTPVVPGRSSLGIHGSVLVAPLVASLVALVPDR